MQIENSKQHSGTFCNLLQIKHKAKRRFSRIKRRFVRVKRRFILAKRRFASSISHCNFPKGYYRLFIRELSPFKSKLLNIESLKDIGRYVKPEKFVAKCISHFGKILDCFVGCNARSDARQNANHRLARIFALCQSLFVWIERTIAALAVWKVEKSNLSASGTYRTVHKRFAKSLASVVNKCCIL